MDNKTQDFLKKALWISLIIMVIRYLIDKPSDAYGVFGCIGETISITLIILIVYERWIWRYIPFQKTPVLYKEYTGKFMSSYDNIERNASMLIKQTLLSTKVTLVTDEGKSRSITASIDDILGEQQLIYCYVNTPKAQVRNRSEIHYGTAILCVDNPKEITGQYFTDRKTTGDMFFRPLLVNIKQKHSAN